MRQIKDLERHFDFIKTKRGAPVSQKLKLHQIDRNVDSSA